MKRIENLEEQYVLEVLRSEFRSSKGSAMVSRLEKKFAEQFQRKYAISFINGTATMHAILEAIGIGPGDEVIVPALTMSSTAMVVLQAGATPVFADIDPDTFLMTGASIRERVTNKSKAIITVSLFGLCPDMNAIKKVAEEYHLFILEDNAQCVSGKYNGRLVGTFGDAASYSFQSSKHMTSGEGGMVTTNSLELAEAVRKISSLGYAGVGANNGKITKQDIQDPNYERHVELGWNYRMPELCAAVALGQLERIKPLVEARIHSAKLFLEALGTCDWLIPQRVPTNDKCDYWAFVVKLAHPQIEWHEFRNKYADLGGDGIYAAWKLVYLEPVFQKKAFLGRERNMPQVKYSEGLCPVAEQVQPKLLQFKTNYWDEEHAAEQAAVLRKTISFFDNLNWRK